jgi:hypothetical protein
MGLISTNILLKSAIEAGLADLRANVWVLKDIFSPMVNDPLSQNEYGQRYVDNAVNWFVQTNIPVFLGYRTDSPEFPCITILPNSRTEAVDRTTLADQGVVTQQDPRQDITQSIIKVTPNFSPVAYDATTGAVTVPNGINLTVVVSGQYLVAKSGKAYLITSVSQPNVITIAPNTHDDFSTLFVTPSTQLYNIHQEETFVRETVTIGVHAQSDPVQNEWLHDIIWYLLLRIKEAFLEGRGMELTAPDSGQLELNSNFNPERVFSRYISITGVLPFSFIKFAAPRLDGVTGGVTIITDELTPSFYLPQANAQGWKMQNDPSGETS